VRWLRRKSGGRARGHAEAFARHLDLWLGPGERTAWPSDDGIMVVRYDDQPEAGVATLVTSGLGHRPLSGPNGKLREELIVTVRQDQADGDLANRLAFEAILIRNRGVAAVPDEVLLIGEGIGSRSSVRGCWVTRVHGFEPAFDTVLGSDMTFLLGQLVPLTIGEYDRAQAVGGHQFGHDVESQWVVLADLDRTALYEPIGPPGGFHWAGLEDLDAISPPDRVDRSQIDRLKVGDIAKLRFRIEPIVTPGPVCEQMWVEIDAVDGDAFSGRLTNTPQYLVALADGHVLEFGRRHVLDVRLR
jgi:Suppressor of fused protein (SUFU)